MPRRSRSTMKVLKSDPNNAVARAWPPRRCLPFDRQAPRGNRRPGKSRPAHARRRRHAQQPGLGLCTSPTDGLRNAKRAIEVATKACELTDYKAAHILSTLAAAYAESGDMKTAIEWSEKAVKLAESQPDGDPETLKHLKEELESYKQGKPWRELMTAPEPKGEQKKPGGEKNPKRRRSRNRRKRKRKSPKSTCVIRGKSGCYSDSRVGLPRACAAAQPVRNEAAGQAHAATASPRGYHAHEVLPESRKLI